MNTQTLFSTVQNFENIDTPGVWVDQNTGQMYRIPPEALKPGHSPLIAVPGAKNLVRLATDFATPTSKVRSVGADHNIFVADPDANSVQSSSATS